MTMKTRTFRKIVDRLVELKDSSELMMDLSYSSLLLNSGELAEEVKKLKKRLETLHTEFEILVLSSGFKPEESKDFLGLIRLGVVTDRIANAAAEIADVVLRGLEPHPVLRLMIKEAEETVSRVIVSKKSSLIDKSIRDACLPEETGMWVLVIRRGKRWLRPKPNTVIMAGDVLIASGYAEGEEDFKNLASGKSHI
jgi:uncharacterized protein with PhoU and TrkA domain